ncbi:MAG: trehalose-phosphatase [Candidatus Ozemobacteraceae bacterium]
MKETEKYPFPERFWSEMMRAGNRLLMLDYDGTIAPFQVNRALAYPTPGIIGLLRKISKKEENRVAVISGRSLAELRKFIGIQGIHLFGSYGMEEEVDGFQVSCPVSEEAKSILEQGRRKIEAAGIMDHLEEKPYSLAFHIRGLQNGTELIRCVMQAWEPLEKTGLIAIIPFDGGVELSAGKTKDFAVDKLLGNSPSETFAVYIGDDDPDEPAFRAVNRFGWGIKAGERKGKTSAKLLLRNSLELVEFLKNWLAVSDGKIKRQAR